jgi:hypothetical protein
VCAGVNFGEIVFISRFFLKNVCKNVEKCKKVQKSAKKVCKSTFGELLSFAL